MKSILRLCLLSSLLFLAAPLAQAETAAAETENAPADTLPTAAQRQAFARQVSAALDASGARLVLLARMGRPLAEMPEGMRFTHVGLAERSATGAGYVIHNLYQYDDRPDRSRLEDDAPAAFFSEVAELEAGILIPSSELQQRLLAVIHSPTYAALHDPRYSLIANPYNLGRQNCTEFILDVIHAALHQTADIQRIKALTQAHFIAEPVRVNPVKLLLAGIFRREVALIDQPGTAVTATFERIAAYLQQVDPGSRVEYLRFAGEPAGISPLSGTAAHSR
ncbi:conserved exported protein of unknown function [Sterolibacterium denitrificans]|uniref:DUF2145 domain-containing protein n=1 Tax=Sterolibacterium denitrificans TaxID=157592 RepID=A0A7Z7MUB5_9PROT|nr:DUF2145 domain-containing protein [Sterolibacterium denitrificans]SMB21073.1 conserved exported protein of unknown function [Sterolibacterium denitrificans]